MERRERWGKRQRRERVETAGWRDKGGKGAKRHRIDFKKCKRAREVRTLWRRERATREEENSGRSARKRLQLAQKGVQKAKKRVLMKSLKATLVALQAGDLHPIQLCFPQLMDTCDTCSQGYVGDVWKLL